MSKTYIASVITERLYINATSKDEAEAKYNAWFRGDDCPEHGDTFSQCKCVDHDEAIDHTMEEYK